MLGIYTNMSNYKINVEFDHFSDFRHLGRPEEQNYNDTHTLGSWESCKKEYYQKLYEVRLY